MKRSALALWWTCGSCDRVHVTRLGWATIVMTLATFAALAAHAC